MCLVALVGVRAPAAVAVEAGRRPAEGSSAAAQAGGGTAAGGICAVVGGLVRVLLVVKAQDVAVVGGAAGDVGEDGVGLGDEGEVVGGVGVGAICVGVVSLGERIEGSGRLVRCLAMMVRRRGDATDFLISPTLASSGTFNRS